MRLPLLACLFSAAFAQPPSDQPFAPRTVRYQGVVIDVNSGAPIPGAAVAIAFTSNGTPVSPLRGTSGAAGRFAFETQYPGRAAKDVFGKVTVTKPGYFEVPNSSYGGQRVEDAYGNLRVSQMIVRMCANGAISGVVLDAGGIAAPGTTLRLISLFGPAGDHDVSKRETVDSKGHFRVPVTPGDYLVCAEPAGEADIETCYPSATSYASATVIAVAPGETAGPLTIRMKNAPRYSIRGKIATLVARTETWGESIVASPVPPDEAGPERLQSVDACVNPDGSFWIKRLRAGLYVLRASAGSEVRRNLCSPPPPPPDFGMTFATDDCGAFHHPPAPVYRGAETISLSRNIKGLVVKVGLGARVAGRVTVENRRAGTSPAKALRLLSWDLDDRGAGAETSIKPGSDGRFVLTDVSPDAYRVVPGAEPAYLTKVVQDGKLSADGRVEVKASGSTALEITLRDASAMLRVDLVRDPLRPPDQPIQVSISPEDPKLRLPADGFRLTRLEPSNQAMLGPFPSGWYLVLACYHDDYPSGGLTKLGWMRIKPRAVRVELREGATETIQAKPLVLKSSR